MTMGGFMKMRSIKNRNRIVTIMQVGGLLAIVVSLILSRLGNQELSVISLIILVLGLLLTIVALILTMKNEINSELMGYCDLCSQYGFDLHKYYTSCSAIWISNVEKNGFKNRIKYSDWKRELCKEYSKMSGDEDLYQCFVKIRRETDKMNDIIKSVIFPVELAIITAFYSQGLYPAYVNIVSIVVLTVVLMTYMIVLISKNERMNECVTLIESAIYNQ